MPPRPLINPDFLEEPLLQRLAGEGSIDELTKLLDDQDEEEYKKWQHLRDVASRKYDFSGFDHINCYTRENFLSGVLEGLEATRRRLSITTAEKLIDFLFFFGYSLKRMIFILFSQGYVNWNRRDIQNYIRRNHFRLNKERQKVIDTLNNAVNSVFQDMKASVMEAEKETLHMYLNNIKELQLALKDISPVTEPTKYTKFSRMIDDLTKKVKGMHGIDELRQATIDISVHKEKTKHNHALDLGLLDDAIREHQSGSLPGVGMSDGAAIDTAVVVID
jgi:hypothetical protein